HHFFRSTITLSTYSTRTSRYPLSLHDALPIYRIAPRFIGTVHIRASPAQHIHPGHGQAAHPDQQKGSIDHHLLKSRSIEKEQRYDSLKQKCIDGNIVFVSLCQLTKHMVILTHHLRNSSANENHRANSGNH